MSQLLFGETVSNNSNITWDIIQQNLDKPWTWYGLSCNPNITWNIVRHLWWPMRLWRVQQNLDKPWCWSALSCNPTFICSEEDIIQFYIRHKAASRIQKIFREANYNPAYLLCQKRIYREFEELVNI